MYVRKVNIEKMIRMAAGPYATRCSADVLRRGLEGTSEMRMMDLRG